MQTITLTSPDDWHCHLRDEQYLSRTVADTSSRFERAIVMPNLMPPITSLAAARAYRSRILSNIPPHQSFTPLMTLYLTETLSPDEIIKGKQQGLITAVKLYPAGVTTHSDRGVSSIASVKPQLKIMQEYDLPLLIHGEIANAETDILRRENDFLHHELTAIINEFPSLRIVLEHISTQEAVDFIKNAPSNVAATITPHHLMLNLNDLLADGIRPHYYCKPVVKQRQHQQALIAAAISGNPKFFLGTDSAPHTRNNKESSCGCAGIYSAHAAIELYTEIFWQQSALDKLENFASQFGRQFYNLPANKKTLTLIRKPWTIPNVLAFGTDELIPLHANQILNWQIKPHENHSTQQTV